MGKSGRTSRFDPVSTLIRLTGPRPRVVVAYSGGIDSTVLAHALLAQRRKLGSLRLAHIDHGLQAASAAWAAQCARQARRWRLPFVARTANIRAKRGTSPEAAAREARYALLAALLEPGEVLVTAQHRDDQAETLLLQLFRGAGLAGLSAMPEVARFGGGWIARPLLAVARAEIERYARRHRLSWVDDPSNTQTRFARNFLRLRVLPLLRERWPGLDEALARSAGHLAEAARLLDTQARRDQARAADGAGLNVAALRALPMARRRNVLRGFIAQAGIELPSTAKMKEITGPLLDARPDAQPHVGWEGGALHRRSGRLDLEVTSEELTAPVPEIAPKSWRWKREREYIVNTRGDRLVLLDDPSGPIDLGALPAILEVRARQGGESLRPGPRARTQSLKKLMQAARIPAAERAHLPLLFAGNRLVAAGDRWIDASIAANDKSGRRARLKFC